MWKLIGSNVYFITIFIGRALVAVAVIVNLDLLQALDHAVSYPSIHFNWCSIIPFFNPISFINLQPVAVHVVHEPEKRLKNHVRDLQSPKVAGVIDQKVLIHLQNAACHVIHDHVQETIRVKIRWFFYQIWFTQQLFKHSLTQTIFRHLSQNKLFHQRNFTDQTTLNFF